MKRIEVVWRDITYKDVGWIHRNDIEDFINDGKENIITQLGYIYRETDQLLILTDSYCMDERTYGTIHKIPKACIISITEITNAQT